MAMDWLKGLVAPVAQFSPTGQPMAGSPAFPAAYAAPGGGPPIGGSPPPGAWGPPPGASPCRRPRPAWDHAPLAPPMGGSPTYGAGMPGVDPNAYGAAYGSPSYGTPGQAPSYGTPGQAPSYGTPGQAPSYGTPGQAPSYGTPGQAPSYGAPSPATGGAGGADARVVALENKCEELKRDLESVALFAQTLLAVLEDKKVMTQQDFQEMRRKLDLMDGRLDDRIAKSP